MGRGAGAPARRGARGGGAGPSAARGRDADGARGAARVLGGWRSRAWSSRALLRRGGRAAGGGGARDRGASRSSSWTGSCATTASRRTTRAATRRRRGGRRLASRGDGMWTAGEPEPGDPDWFDRLEPMPLSAMDTPIALTGEVNRLPRTFVLCERWGMGEQAERALARGWQVRGGGLLARVPAAPSRKVRGAAAGGARRT